LFSLISFNFVKRYTERSLAESFFFFFMMTHNSKNITIYHFHSTPRYENLTKHIVLESWIQNDEEVQVIDASAPVPAQQPRFINLKLKIELIEYVEKNAGLSFAKIAKNFSELIGRDIPKQTVHRIFKNKEKIHGMAKTSRKEIYRIKDLEVRKFEKALANEIHTTYESTSFTRDRITKIARQIQNLDYFLDKPTVQKMKFSLSWYNDFLKQNHLAYRRNRGSKEIAPSLEGGISTNPKGRNYTLTLEEGYTAIEDLSETGPSLTGKILENAADVDNLSPQFPVNSKNDINFQSSTSSISENMTNPSENQWHFHSDV
jgi:hypothetical protein